MTLEQEANVLNWVEAMLSGQYKHGRQYLFNPATKCHSAFGVAAEVMGVKHDPAGVFTFPLGFMSRMAVSPSWFTETFGLRRTPFVYSSINDASRNYLGVVALLLNTVPLSKRHKQLHKIMLEQSYVQV